MAEAVQTQGSGGGEGPATPSADTSKASFQEPKSIETIIIEEAKKEVAASLLENAANLPEVNPLPEVKPLPEIKPLPEDKSIPEVNPLTEAKSLPEVKSSSEAKSVEEINTTPAEAVDIDVNKEEETNGVAKQSDNWQSRETELLKKIEDLEKVKTKTSEEGLRLELKVREEEIDLLKARVKNLETELQAALSKPSGKNHEMIEKIKQQHDELLSKARGMIFDKTKMVKNQELQIEALTTQVQSLKDINLITKDLLEIRNSEVKAMEERFQAMDARFKAEKERYALVLQRAQTSTNINEDLRKEYETQLAIFKQLREKYEQRVQALVAENERLKGSLEGKPSA